VFLVFFQLRIFINIS